MKRQQHPDAYYKAHEGFALYTSVSDTVTDYIAVRPLYELDVHSAHNDVTERGLAKICSYELSPSQAALIGIQRQITRYSVFDEPADHPEDLQELMGVSPEEFQTAKSHSVLLGGFNDFSFIWSFAPALAAGIVHEYIDSGVISQEQYADFTLGDWADIIGSGWFASLTHDLALAKNGTYGTFGEKLMQHQPGAFRDKFKRRFGLGNIEPFNLVTQYEPEDGHYYRGATLTSDVRVALRKSREEKSVGCPVARNTTTLSNVVIKNNVRIQELLASGRMAPSGKQVSEDRTHLEVQYTAIDRTLALFADKLDDYERQFGTPRPRKTSEESFEWAHHSMQPTNLMRFKKEPDIDPVQ